MKKALLMISLLLCSVTICACQETPSSKSVGNKNAGIMLEALGSRGDDAQTLDITQTYTYEKSFCIGKASCHIDASIAYAQENNLPVYAASITPFSETEIANAVQAYSGDDVFLTRSSDAFTQAEIAERILLPAQQKLTLIQSGQTVYDEAGALSEAQMMREIAGIRSRIARAPEAEPLDPLF